MDYLFDIGYLKHTFGVYCLGLVAVFVFIFLNADLSNKKELAIGTALLISFYSIIMFLIFISVPLISNIQV